MSKLIDLIAGARPNFMKVSPIIDASEAARARGGSLDYRQIHTGQHHDRAIAARKLGVPVANMEDGLRSRDWTMPEEINRVVTDSITNWLLTTSVSAGENLHRAGVSEANIFFVGNTMIDTLLKHMLRLRPPSFWDALGLQLGSYCVVTLHRPRCRI